MEKLHLNIHRPGVGGHSNRIGLDWIGILDRLPRKVKVVIYQSTLTSPPSRWSVFLL